MRGKSSGEIPMPVSVTVMSEFAALLLHLQFHPSAGV